MSQSYTQYLNLLKATSNEPLTNAQVDRLFGANLDAIDASVHALDDKIDAIANAGWTPVAPIALSGNALKFRIENASTLFDIPTLLRSLPSGTPVRITGFTMTLDSVSALTAFYELLDTLTGLDANMGGLTKAQMHGTIRLSRGSSLSPTPITVTGEQLAAWTERYPSMTVIPERIENHVYYYSYDGSELLYSETVYDNADAAYSNAPARAASGGYMYSFAGWSSDSNSSTADAVLTNVTENRRVYAAYICAQNVAPSLEITDYSTATDDSATVRVTAWGAYPRLLSLTSTDETGNSVTAQAGSAVLSVSGNLITITPTENYYNAIAWELTFADTSGSARCNVSINLKNIPVVSVTKKSTGEDDPIILSVSSFGRYPNVKGCYIRRNASSSVGLCRTADVSVSGDTVTITPHHPYANGSFSENISYMSASNLPYVTFEADGLSGQTVNLPLDMFDIPASS